MDVTGLEVRRGGAPLDVEKYQSDDEEEEDDEDNEKDIGKFHSEVTKISCISLRRQGTVCGMRERRHIEHSMVFFSKIKVKISLFFHLIKNFFQIGISSRGF